MKVSVRAENWRMKEPFRISGQVFENAKLLSIEITDGAWHGRGEACGVYYRGDDIANMERMARSAAAEIEAGLDRHGLQYAMPPCGARNALDCALWELEAMRAGKPVWQIAGLPGVEPLPTVFTIGIGTAETMAGKAAAMNHADALKLKLSGDAEDADRIAAVRAARPDAWLGVDANQGFTSDSLDALMPALVAARIAVIEQPFPADRDADLAGLDRTIPLAADESVQHIGDLEPLVGLVDIINIKLDKCGGLTHALEMERAARALGFEVMVGNMTGTSWSQAPAFVLGQLCSLRDLDGVTFLAEDRDPGVRYADGKIYCPDTVWGIG